MMFFTSDLHFGSDKVIKFENRPFKNAQSFIKQTVKKWNRQASPNDVIYVVGDFTDCHDETKNSSIKLLAIVKKVKAKLVLILGNNEERIIKYFFDNSFEKFKNYCLEIGFLDVKQNAKIKINNKEFYLTHKPKDCRADMLNLFGHSHKAIGLYKAFGFNIGCDLNNYNLYSESDVLQLCNKKEKFWDKDENLKLI